MDNYYSRSKHKTEDNFIYAPGITEEILSLESQKYLRAIRSEGQKVIGSANTTEYTNVATLKNINNKAQDIIALDRYIRKLLMN